MIQVGAQLISVTCRDEKNDFGESLGSEFELEVNSVDVWYSWRMVFLFFKNKLAYPQVWGRQ